MRSGRTRTHDENPPGHAPQQVSAPHPSQVPVAPPPQVTAIADLQRTVGNRAVSGFFPSDAGRAHTPPFAVQRVVTTLTPLTSIRLSDSPRLQAAARNSPSLKFRDPDRDAVKRVQETLIDDGFTLPRSKVALTYDSPRMKDYKGETVDGIYGGETLTAVKKFQRKHELTDDGVIGAKTMAALDGVASHRNPSDEPIAPKLGENERTRKFSRDEYIAMWEKKHGRRMTGEERHDLARGCIGVTALNLQGGGTANPPLGLSFGSLDRARQVAAALTRILQATTSLDGLSPEVINAAPELANLKNVVESLPSVGTPDQYKGVVFSKRFYSNQAEKWHDRLEADEDAFQPDEETGQVDMSGYQYRGRPNPKEGEGREFTNFDYAWYDEDTDSWFHANHAEMGPDAPMEVYQSTLEHYSRPLQDFDRQVFSVAFARKP